MNKLKKNQQSVTYWTNLLIAGIVLTIILIIALGNLLENPESRQIRQLAEQRLRLFARGYSLNAINCQGVDHNSNGWVNCRADDRKGKTVLVECPYKGEAQECRYQ